jgi:HEAT repeat protein
MLGAERVGPGRQALEGARTGGDVRTRAAVREALAMLDPGESGPPPVVMDGFEDSYLAPESFTEITKTLPLESWIVALQDGRDVVRGNAATALGVLGEAAQAAARPLSVLLRDDAAAVRLAAAQALDKMGKSVIETADDLTGALGDKDAGVAEAAAVALAGRGARILGALLRGLETDDPVHARRILALINRLEDASEILCDAFESPAVNVQVNAALGLGMLGAERLGPGRQALEGARTGGDVRTREAVFAALAMLDRAS